MKTVLFILMSFVCCFAIAQESSVYKKVKIKYNNVYNYRLLEKEGIPMDHGIHKQGVFIISDYSEREIEIVKRLGIDFDILIEDVTSDFLKKNKVAKIQNATKNLSCPTDNNPIITYPTPSNFSLGSMGGYLTYQEMLDNLDEMQTKYPNLITARADVGTFLTNGTPNNSVSPSIGGNALQWVRISDNPDTDEPSEPEILYNSIHHAREPASLSQLIYFMWYLLENYETDSEIKAIVDNTQLYFIPVVNPDGYLYNELTNPNGGGLWRKNRFNTHGVDNNRNYDHYTDGTAATSTWNTVGTSNDTSSNIYAGASAFSEVETQAMKWFIEQHNFTISMDNHTSGELLLMPYGYEPNNPTPEGDIYQTISEELVSQNNYSNILITDLTVAAGGSVDYMYGGTVRPHNRIFGFAPEIGTSFWPTSNLIDGICKEMMYLNITAAKMTHNFAKAQSNQTEFIGDNTTFNADYTINRLGLNGNGNFTVSIVPISGNIQSVGASKSYTNLTIGNPINDQITINLNNTIDAGDEIVYDIEVNGGIIKHTTRVTQKFGSFQALVDNNADTLNDFTGTGWDTTNTTFVSASSSITESPSGNYGSNQNKIIELDQSIDLTNVIAATIQFYAKWDIENNWDYTQFEVSIDNGASWIPQCGKFTNSGSSNAGQPTGEPLYDGTQTEWVLEEISLSDYLGETIKVRFQFVSDDQVERDGFYFDDLVINTLNQNTLDIEENVLSEFTVFPNPLKDILTITPNATSNFNIQLKDVVGKEVMTKKQASGNQEFDLSKLNAGLYFLTIELGESVKTFKIIKQ
ncbi:M14 family zinc carboxypeptidase [Aquimarina litoralis]